MAGVTLPAQFIEEAPTYVVKNGHMHIDYGSIRLVVPVHVSMVAIGRFNRALDEWHAEQGNVVPIKARS